MAKKRRLYRKNGRFYGDFRSFSDVGGAQEALKPDGERYATKDIKVAKRLAKARIKELKRIREAGMDMGADLRRLGPFVDYHLEEEAKLEGATEESLSQTEHRLNAAIDHFGENTLLRSKCSFPESDSRGLPLFRGRVYEGAGRLGEAPAENRRFVDGDPGLNWDSAFLYEGTIDLLHTPPRRT